MDNENNAANNSEELNDNIEIQSTEDTGIARKRKYYRIIAVSIVMLATVFLAVVSGALIAIWDMGKTPHDLMMIIDGTYVTAKAAELAKEQEEAVEDETGVEVVNSILENTRKTFGNGAEPSVQEPEEDVTSDDLAAEDEDILASTDTQELQDADTQTEPESDEMEEQEADAETVMMRAEDIAAASPAQEVNQNAGYPLAFTTVDYSYFNDALFIGDSRMQGFGMYSGLPATFYAITSFQLHKYETMKVVQTASGKVPIFDAIPYDTFTKVYIKVGLNELGCSSEADFEAKYDELIARIRVCEPRAIIYIHGILPVTAAKSSTDHTHSNENITARNNALIQFAQNHQAYYLDVGSAYAMEDGTLPPEMAADGIHLKSQYMEAWKEYLRTHAVVVN